MAKMSRSSPTSDHQRGGIKLLILLRVRQEYGGSTRDQWPVINYDFRPAASYIRRGPDEADRLPARIGPQTQREQIGETERSLDMEPVVGFESHADRECCRRKAL